MKCTKELLGVRLAEREPIVRETREQAIELANASPYGLLSAIFTRDLAKGLRYADEVKTGWVNVNDSSNYWEAHLPLGGRAGTTVGPVGDARPGRGVGPRGRSLGRRRHRPYWNSTIIRSRTIHNSNVARAAAIERSTRRNFATLRVARL